MNYLNTGNVFQDQGFFQINTSVAELLTNPTFKLLLSGQYHLQLVDVTVDSQFFSVSNTNTSCEIYNLRSPQFSGPTSQTPGITFMPPTLIKPSSAGNALVRITGSVKPSAHQIVATLNGSITLNLLVWGITDGGTTAEYDSVVNQNLVISFGFQYSKVK
jgi:hypothetical protein